MDPPDLAGIVLAAGGGARMGMPKALADDGRWLRRAVDSLLLGGCGKVFVVLGARADDAERLLEGREVVVVRVENWQHGLSTSLRAGLLASASTEISAAVVTLVDLPDQGPEAVRRVVELAGPQELIRASYNGRPGHPVLIGRAHFEPLLTELRGDSGARAYLAAHAATEVECGDLGSGRDQDTVL